MQLEESNHQNRRHWRGRSGVVASLADLVDMRLAARRLEDPARRASIAGLAGPHRSPLLGSGMDFEEVRTYQPGDDVRSIDWRVTARTGRPHSKVYREERERPVWIYTDLGPSMRFGTRCAFKSVAAARAAALVAWSARRAGDRVGALVHTATGVRLFKPRGQEESLFRILGAMARGTADSSDAPSESQSECLARLCESVRSGSRLVLLSDFADLDDTGRTHLARLARRAAVTCVLVHDATEVEPPPSGRYRVSNGEDVISMDTGGDRWRKAYCDHFLARFTALRDFCAKHRIGLAPLQTDDDPAEVLAENLSPRRRTV
jgi:uncharacterized protein (DUF58 family)